MTAPCWHTCSLWDIPDSQGRGVCHAPQPKKLHRVCLALSLHVSTAGSASAMKECGPPIPVQIVVLGKCGNSCRARKRKPGSLGPGVLGSRGQIAENPTLGKWKGDGRKYLTWTRAPFPERSSTVPSEFTYKFKDQTVKHFKMVITGLYISSKVPFWAPSSEPCPGDMLMKPALVTCKRKCYKP